LAIAIKGTCYGVTKVTLNRHIESLERYADNWLYIVFREKDPLYLHIFINCTLI